MQVDIKVTSHGEFVESMDVHTFTLRPGLGIKTSCSCLAHQSELNYIVYNKVIIKSRTKNCLSCLKINNFAKAYGR